MADHRGLRKHGIYFGNHNWFQKLRELIVKQEVWLARQTESVLNVFLRSLDFI